MVEGVTLTIMFFSLAATVSSACLKGRPRASSVVSSILNSIASALMIVAGLQNLILLRGSVQEFTLLPHVPIPHSSLVLGYDWLTSILVTLLGFVSLMVSIYSARHLLSHSEGDVRGIASILPIFTLSMFLVLTARDLLWFFIFWEIMTVSSLALVLYNYTEEHVRFSGILYATTMHVGAMFLLVGLLLLSSIVPSHSLLYSSIASQSNALVSNPLTYVSVALITIGFLFKAGIVPLHLWLPDAHSVAPSNVSALLSGMMVKIGIYGIMRFALMILAPCIGQTYGLALMGLAALSVAVGSAYSAVQDDYKRLLAYSTIENAGIIMLAVSAASLGLASGVRWLYFLGVTAALFHMINHSIFKSLMFLNAGVLLRTTGTRSLSMLGGLSRRLRFTSVSMAIGSLSASAMPPLNGFASKFLVYETLLMAATSLGIWYLRLVSLLSTASLVLCGVLTMLAFSKLYGSAFLGKESGIKVRESESSVESAPIIILSIACIVTSIVAPAIVSWLLRVQHAAGISALSSFGVLLVLRGGRWTFPAVVSYGMLSVVMAIAFAIASSSYRRGLRKSMVEPFVSGVRYLDSVHRPRAEALTQLVRDYMSGMLGVRRFVRREYLVRNWTVGRLIYEVRMGRHLVDPIRLRDAGEFFERVFYAPPYRLFKGFASRFKNLQSGNLLLYIAYIYVVYVVLLGLILWLR